MSLYRIVCGAAAVLALYLITHDTPEPAWASIGASICGGVIWTIAGAEWRARRDAQANRALRVRFQEILARAPGSPLATSRAFGAGMTFTERALRDTVQEAHPAIRSAKTTTIEPGVVDIVVTVAWWAWPAFMRRRVCRAVERAIEPQVPAGVRMRVRMERS